MHNTISTSFTGISYVGVSDFDVPVFQVGYEQVFFNGLRLTRNIGYTLLKSAPEVEGYDVIVLTNPPTVAGDILEVITPDTSSEVTMETLDSKLDTLILTVSGLETAAYGSWVWDKSTGILTMLDSSGDEQFKFEVSDSAELASRERRQDLED